MKLVLQRLAVGLIGAAALIGSATANQLTYTPVNPTFGGNVLNGPYLLNVAQSQGFGFTAKQQSSQPDLSGLNAAISSLGQNLGTNSTAPVITITLPPTGIPTTP